MRRYETRSTLMTSNRPLEDWGKLIGDVPSATATHRSVYRRRSKYRLAINSRRRPPPFHRLAGNREDHTGPPPADNPAAVDAQREPGDDTHLECASPATARRIAPEHPPFRSRHRPKARCRHDFSLLLAFGRPHAPPRAPTLWLPSKGGRLLYGRGSCRLFRFATGVHRSGVAQHAFSMNVNTENSKT
jgi:hypothetical protein